jgi:hypothetical protein
MTPRWLVEPAAVALGDVPAEQRELARNLIAADPEFRAEVERLRLLTQQLDALPADAWDLPAAPPLDLDRVLVRPPAAAGPASSPSVTESPPAAGSASAGSDRRAPARWRLRPVVAVAAAVVLLLVGGVAGALLAGGDGADRRAGGGADTDPWVLATLRPLPERPSSASGRVALTLHAGGRARLRLSGLAPTRRNAFYEAWLMTDDRDLVALGTFVVGADGRAAVEFPLGADPRGYRYVDVSLQHRSDGPAHSGDSVLRSAQLG